MSTLTMALESELLLHITSGKSLAELREWIETAARENGHPESLPFDMADNYAARFAAMVETTRECWFWRGAVDSGGYGQFAGKRAHRVAWELVNGPIEQGQFVCHRCDTRDCVRPNHMFLGDHYANMEDMVSKGRSTRGVSKYNWSTHSRAKLTPAAARRIMLMKGKIRQCDLAREYGVAPSAIHKVWAGERWKHVTAPLAHRTAPTDSALDDVSR